MIGMPRKRSEYRMPPSGPAPAIQRPREADRQHRHRGDESCREADHGEDAEGAERLVRRSSERAAAKDGDPERHEIGGREMRQRPFDWLIKIRRRAMYEA